MKLLLIILLAVLCAATVKASLIPANPLTPDFGLPAIPVATSYQVVTRNVNRAIASPVLPPIAYPAGYAGTWSNYPYNYRPGYGYGYPYNHIHNYGFGYGYPYGYGASVW